MKKTDNRVYNRKTQRDLSIEMDLWIALHSKHIYVKGASFDEKPVDGKIINVEYHPNNRGNLCIIFVENGSQYAIKVNNGKLIMPLSTEIKIS